MPVSSTPFIDRTFIADWGCQSVSIFQAIPGVIAVLALFALVAVPGRFAGGSRRWLPADIISGWGLLTLVLTLSGLYLPFGLSAVLLVLGAMVLTGIFLIIFRNNPWKPASTQVAPKHYFWLGVTFVLQLWVLLLINKEGITFWDDFSHWTLNALYLWQNDALPASSLPKPYAVWSAYPYALPFLTYAASLMRGAFLTQGGAMINWMLLAVTAWALVETRFEANESKPGWLFKMASLGLAILLVTVFNPGFNASYTVSNGSDTPTAFAVVFCGLILMQWHGAFQKGDRREIIAPGVQFALAAVVLVMLRQVNIVLLALLAAGFLVTALKARFLGKASGALVLALVPALLLRWAWQDYTQQALPGGSFSVLPFAEWRWALLPEAFLAAGKEILEKWGYFLLMGCAGAAGIRFLFRPLTPRRVFGIITATVFLGYIGFIFTAYVAAASFSPYEIKRAASFYRYSTHVCLPGVAFLWFYLRPCLERKPGKPWRLKAFTTFVWLVLPVIYLAKPGWVVPQARPALCEDRALGQKLAKALPSPSRFVLIDPKGNGFRYFIINFEFALDDSRRQTRLRAVDKIDELSADRLEGFLSGLSGQTDVNAVYLPRPEGGDIDPALRSMFGLAGDSPGGLFVRKEKSWAAVPLQ